MAHHAEQAGRPEDGSSREKAEAPAEVAAGAASVEVAADAESHKKAPAEVFAGAPSVEDAADESCRKVKSQRQMEAQESVWSPLTRGTADASRTRPQ